MHFNCRYSVFFGIVNTDVGVGIGISKYRISVRYFGIPTQDYNSNGNEHLAESDHDKSEALQEFFFSSVYTVESEEEFVNLPQMTNSTHKYMSDIIVTQEDIYDKLCRPKLKTDKSPGVDMLHPRVLFETRDIIVTRFTLYIVKV